MLTQSKRQEPQEQQTAFCRPNQTRLSVMDPGLAKSRLDDFQGSFKVPTFYDIPKPS